MFFGVFMVANAHEINLTTKNAISQFRENPKISPYFNDSYAYIIYPSITKGGLIIGFGEGTGTIFREGLDVGEAKVTLFSLGAQLGAQTYSQIIFFKDQSAYKNFLAQGFIFSANASAAFITLGANAQAGTGGVSSSASAGDLAKNTSPRMDGAYNNSIATFMLTKAGLMGQATLGGETFDFTFNNNN